MWNIKTKLNSEGLKLLPFMEYMWYKSNEKYIKKTNILNLPMSGSSIDVKEKRNIKQYDIYHH